MIIKDITDFIFIEHQLEPADIIFIPGGSHPELGEIAAELYNKGLAKWILPSGGFSVKTGRFDGVKSRQEIYSADYQTEWQFLKDVLLINGVPESAILKEDQAGLTLENGAFSRRVCDEHGLSIKRAIIVCKSFHARRCQMIYSAAFPNAELMIKPFDYYKNGTVLTRDNWHLSEVGIDRVFGELRRCGDQLLEQMKIYIKYHNQS